MLSASGRKIVFARGHIVAAKAVYDTGRGKDGGRISGTHVTPLVRPVGMPVLTPLEEAAPDPVAVPVAPSEADSELAAELEAVPTLRVGRGAPSIVVGWPGKDTLRGG